MLTLAAHLVFHFLTAVLIPRVGRALCRLVKHIPVVAAAKAVGLAQCRSFCLE